MKSLNQNKQLIQVITRKEFFKNLFNIILLALIFGYAYAFIFYDDLNFLKRAKNNVHSQSNERFRNISIDEARNYFDKAVLIDARDEESFKNGHISNAMNIPAKHFDNYIEKIVELPQDTLIIIYCEGIHCNLSHQLAEKMSLFGFKNIWIMFEGIEGWQQKKLPVVK